MILSQQEDPHPEGPSLALLLHVLKMVLECRMVMRLVWRVWRMFYCVTLSQSYLLS